MKIVRFVENVVCGFKKSAGGATITFESLRDYVISQAQLDRILPDENVRNRLYKISNLDPRLQPFNAKFQKSGRLLFYNGSGGYGDQIVSWPVAKWLADQGMEVHILTDPGNQTCWYNFPWVKTINFTPLAYELFKMFDHHFMMEQVNNADEHPDQLHPVDAMFSRMGIDWRSIPPEAKNVRPVYTWAELQAKHNFPDRPKIGLFQLSSANPVRCLPPNDTAFLLSKIADAFTDTHWVALYDEFVAKEYVSALNCKTCNGTGNVPNPEAAKTEAPPEAAKTEAPPEAKPEAKPEVPPVDATVVCPDCRGWKYICQNIQPWICPSLRDLWSFTNERASVVVASDSLMVHVAGCQGVPCVGLWGPVASLNRTQYYKNHVPVWKREVCPHAPCFSYTSTFPRYCPPRGSARVVCEVLAAIMPAEVIAAISKVRR